MHVCHFCDTTFETDFFRNIVARLTDRGVRVSLVELATGPPPTWLVQFPGVEYLNLGASNKIQYPGAAYRLSRFLSLQDVDILHTHLFFSGIIGLLSKRLRPNTIVALMRHHTGVVRMLGTRIHIAADKWMAQRADHVMTVSEAARAYMRETDGIDRDDIEIVHIGFDFEKLAPSSESRSRLRDEFGFAADDFVIGYVANFVPGKGHLQLVQAFEQVSKEISAARLFLIGQGMLSDLESAAERIGPSRVIFGGWRDDIPACLNAMDLFVQPSLSEAFSQVLIEAMGTGLPVIATDVGGAREVIDDGENGILIEAGQAETIAEQIRRVYNDPGLRTRLAAGGRRSVLERFTAERMVDRLFSLYSGWLADKK